MLEKIDSLVPYSSQITQYTNSFYGYSKEKASDVYCYSAKKIKSS